MKALPPGIELSADRGKAVPPGIQSHVAPITPDIDTPANKALPPGTELNTDRSKLLATGINNEAGLFNCQSLHCSQISKDL
jgi:hypothetical protein